MEKICYIIGAGEIHKLNINPNPNDYIIAADGGYKYLKEINIIPDIIVGDFDSSKYPENQDTIKLYKIKDTTDMFEAMKIAYKKGYKKCLIYGALGGRISHSIANISQMVYFVGKMDITLIDENTTITATNSKINIDYKNLSYISVFSYTPISKGVNIKGLKYELKNATLKANYPLGVSNESIGKPAEITVEDGILIIITEKRDEAIIKIEKDREKILQELGLEDNDNDLWGYLYKGKYISYAISTRELTPKILFKKSNGNKEKENDLIDYIKYYYKSRKF
ncbi:MAG: thiamine diphosphokinase [Tissierellia bacterium]|nr:thiamine diphosphokinase [Tissierellia bacterium]